RQGNLLRPDRPPRRLDPDDPPAVPEIAGDLAVLNDVDPARVRAAGIAPGHRVVACGAGALLPEPAVDWEAGIVRIIQDRNPLPDFVARQDLGVDPVHPHDV